MGSSAIEEVFRVANNKDLAETGGGHNQKGVDFQRAWALSRMFELEESGANDFLILFEAVQDVAELDSETAPSSIRVYQVKKRDRGEWDWSNLTLLPAPGKKPRPGKSTDEIKDSPIGKLYSAVLAFKDLESSGVFLSNAGCNLPLANGDNAATSLSCDLSQLEAGHLDLLKVGLESLHEAGASPANPKLIRVEKVPIHPDAPATHLQGVAVAFLNKRSPRHAGQAKSLVDALLAEVGPLGAKTNSCSNFDELRRQKGYSRGQFASALGSLEQVPDLVSLAETWLDKLVTEGAMNFMEATRVRIAMAAIYKRQVMGGELLASIHLQTNLANEALSIYEGDSQFLRSEPREALVCPVCNAEHSESFLDLLTYAEDARSLRDITVHLRKDAREIENKLSKTNAAIAALEQSYRKVAALLSIRRGDMQFSQVVESMGAEKAFRAFEEERVILETEMADHLLEHERMTEAMNKLTDRNRSKEILKIFREAYSAALVELSLPMTDTSKAKLTSRPNLSGSGGPRSVLAYYAALWAACYGEKGSFRIPLVVDAPNQQGQDHINLPKVISFLSSKLPQGAQLILGSEIDTDLPFDRKIELTEQYKLLSESDFDEAEATLGPLVLVMYLKAS